MASISEANRIQFKAPSPNGWWTMGPGSWLLVAGLCSLVVPTFLNLGRWSWSSEAGAHGPIVLATDIWLVWRERDLLRVPHMMPPLWPALLPLLIALLCYALGRITGVLMVESLSLYVVILSLGCLRYGGAVMRRFWFPWVYALFLITPPENWMFVATRPIKAALSHGAVDLLAACGLMVGSAGSTIQIDGYELLVATACSGVNSLIGISAISLFYVYMRRGSAPAYAAILLLLLLPIAILTNFLRIIGLVLATHWFGEEAAQGVAHEAAGLGTFGAALALLMIIDAALFPAYRRVGGRRA